VDNNHSIIRKKCCLDELLFLYSKGIITQYFFKIQILITIDLKTKADNIGSVLLLPLYFLASFKQKPV